MNRDGEIDGTAYGVTLTVNESELTLIECLASGHTFYHRHVLTGTLTRDVHALSASIRVAWDLPL